MFIFTTKLCVKIEDVRTIFPVLNFSIGPAVSELGNSDNFGGKCPIAVFAHKFLICQPNHTIILTSVDRLPA